MATIHETAVIHKDAKIGENVSIGPFAVIGRHVIIKDNSEIASHSSLDWVEIGTECKISQGVVLGGSPQVLKHNDCPSYVKIGDNNIIREYVTIHRSMKENGATVVGDNNYIMSYAHIAHDCQIGNDTIITSYAGLSGHVIVEDKAVIGGAAGIHQFVKIGSLSMIGGMTRVVKDVPPYFLVEGNPAEMMGLNTIGLRRNGIKPKARDNLKRAFKILYQSGLNISQALETIKKEIEGSVEINHLIEFIEKSQRGVIK
jgi:UDP-N-acetylglucosamine acyltransferase